MINRFASAAVIVATLLLMVGWLAGRTGGEMPIQRIYAADAGFDARFAEQAKRFATGRMLDTIPILAPEPGDVYVKARRWVFDPALELKAGGVYRLHLLAEDAVHSAAIGEAELLLEPGQVTVVELTAPASGRVRLQCGEYCGLGHTKMIGSIESISK